MTPRVIALKWPRKLSLSDAVDQPFRRPALEHSEHDRRARYGEHEDQAAVTTKAMTWFLVIAETQAPIARARPPSASCRYSSRGSRRCPGRPRKLTVIQNGKVKSERDPGESPGGEEFSEHRLGDADRQCQKQLDRPGLALLGPQPHRRAPGSGQVEPGMKAEESLQIGLAALEEVADKERRMRRPSRGR